MDAGPVKRLGSRGRSKRGLTLIECLVVLAIIAILIALLLPNVRTSRGSARRVQCKNNLKQIGLALHNYHDVYGALPPAYTVDAEGKPLHSWRTLILPFIEQKRLYDGIDLSKPWDDPVNAKAYATNIPVFQCPSATIPPGHTTYLAVAAEGGCFRPGESRAFSEITDGPSQTLMVIEVEPAHAVPWMAPVDADENLVLGFGPKSGLPHSGVVQALFGDGSVRFLSADTPAAERRALITVAGDDGDQISQ